MAVVAGLGALASAGTSIYGAIKGNSPAANVPLPSSFIFPNRDTSANAAFQGIQNLPGQQIPGQTLPQYQNIAQGLVNNPYAQMFQQGANTISPYGQLAGMGAYNAGQDFSQAGQASIPYASRIAQTAFDPQNALYQKTQHDLIDQTRAAQAARGVATTPYGAAGESDALRKFDIDWQNAQLGRQIAGGEGAGNVLGAGFKTSAGGSALSDTGVGSYLNASGLPYSTYGQIGGGQLSALNSLFGGTQQAQSIGTTPVDEYLKYLGLANQAGAVANQGTANALNQANLGFNQNQALGAGLGAGLAGIGNAAKGGNWNWLSGFGSGPSFSGSGTQSSMGGGYGGGVFG